jgi:nucleoside-diphosphate-sugar epimerase
MGDSDDGCVGASAVEVDLFDRDGLVAAVAGHDAVLNLATAIPTGERAAHLEPWEDNHRIRRDGARNLVDAALAAGSTRYVQESIALLYADGGDAELDESAPVEATSITAWALEAELQVARFASNGGTGVALRFGWFYGWDSAHTVEAIEAAFDGQSLEIGPANAYRPTVLTDDAASTVVAALQSAGGIYNVADDNPLRRSEHAEAMAEALGAGPLVPTPIAPTIPADFSMMFRSHRINSDRFRDATGWRPRYPSVREGLPFVLREMQDNVAMATQA